jgi:Co/Zn/Cd efflux system component
LGLFPAIVGVLRDFLIVLVAVPLIIDSSAYLLQQSTPDILANKVEEKIQTISLLEGVVRVKKWNFWCIDSRLRVCKEPQILTF